jgi:hypothetical protein
MSGHVLRWVGCGLLLLAGGAGPEVRLKSGKAAAVLKFDQTEQGRQQLRLSSVVRLTLTVEGLSPLEVEPWKMETEHWRSRPAGPPEIVQQGNGLTRWRQAFRLSPQAPGKELPLQLAPLHYRERDGPLQDAAWTQITVDVLTRWTNPTPADMEDITSIEELPPDDGVSLYTVLAWAGGGILFLGVAALVGWRVAERRRRPRPKLPPEQAAQAELDRLLALDLPGRGEGGRFHTLLGDVMRRYLDDRYGLQTLRQTSAECLEAVRESAVWDEDRRGRLRGLLEQCDRVKFSGTEATTAECQCAAETVRRLVSG